MNEKWISSFITVAETGSINAAARKLFISPQALTQQLNLMEEELGLTLFSRGRGGMRLTLAGREFYHGALKSTAEYHALLERCALASRAEDVIRIPMMSGIVRPEFMESVCAAFQRSNQTDLRIEYVDDENMSGWMDGLRGLKYDIIEHFAIDGIVASDVHFESLSTVESWCIMGEQHPLAGYETIVPEDLEGCTILMPDTNQKLVGYLSMYMTNKGIHVSAKQVPNARYSIIKGINEGGIFIANKEIAKVFVGFRGIPLDFDTHVQHGLACRADRTDKYREFFELARQYNDRHERDR